MELRSRRPSAAPKPKPPAVGGPLQLPGRGISPLHPRGSHVGQTKDHDAADREAACRLPRALSVCVGLLLMTAFVVCCCRAEPDLQVLAKQGADTDLALRTD